jgi:hypothetical protein
MRLFADAAEAEIFDFEVVLDPVFQPFSADTGRFYLSERRNID